MRKPIAMVVAMCILAALTGVARADIMEDFNDTTPIDNGMEYDMALNESSAQPPDPVVSAYPVVGLGLTNPDANGWHYMYDNLKDGEAHLIDLPVQREMSGNGAIVWTDERNDQVEDDIAIFDLSPFGLSETGMQTEWWFADGAVEYIGLGYDVNGLDEAWTWRATLDGQFHNGNDNPPRNPRPISSMVCVIDGVVTWTSDPLAIGTANSGWSTMNGADLGVVANGDQIQLHPGESTWSDGETQGDPGDPPREDGDCIVHYRHNTVKITFTPVAPRDLAASASDWALY